MKVLNTQHYDDIQYKNYGNFLQFNYYQIRETKLCMKVY